MRNLGFEVVPLRTPNPTWTRDELILALDFYLQHRPNPPGKESAEIAEVSTTLNGLAAALGVAHENTYRNANGVYMKLMNLRHLDPTYQAQGKIGLTRGGKEDEIIWEEFAGDPGRCHSVADAIRSGIEAAEASPVPPSEDDLDDGIEAQEGRLLTALHRRQERNRTLVDKKKAKVLAGQQRMSCEVSGFDFAATYDERGVGFIECHHTKPVSEAVGQTTRLADLALLCAN